ncbi:MAG: NAD-dependent epimerase/dehydratase family protein [Anaerolineae bacterium]|nr:NAD-dependent epimerase/dehydratase family protein [Anaerolineae bacterium]MDW8101257.1 NAD-dependent epimerase/dehydratase family protein [Anaerolineae bacterium]
MKAFVTGGTGFIGGAVVRKLIESGHQVKALVRPGANTRQLDGLPVEKVEGSLEDINSLRRGIEGCDWVFHLAALYSFWGYRWEDFYRVNVEGTRLVLEVAREMGVQRIVHTSSIAALGTNPDRTPANENTPSTLEDKVTYYQRSKFLGQQVALELAREGVPVVIVNPTAPVGPGDHKPTPTGQIIVDFLNGRMFGYVDTGLNIVDVEDVAKGHILAAERGRVGECYILGGENMTLKQFLDLLAEVSGRPPVRWRIPHWVAMLWAYIDVALTKLGLRSVPTATPEKVRLSRRYEWFDCSKAMRELGYTYGPAREAVRKAVEWYRANGYAP